MLKRNRSIQCLVLFALINGCQRTTLTDPMHLIQPQDARRLGYKLGAAIDLGLPRGHRIEHAVVFDDLLLIVESPTNLVTGLSARDGSTVWKKVVGGRTERLFRPERVDDRIVINTNTDLYILHAETGKQLRRQTLETRVTHGPAMFGSLAIFGGSDGVVFAHNLATGTSSWRRKMSGRVPASPVVVHNRVFVADVNGQCRMFSASSGEFFWEFRTFGPVWAAPAINPVAIFVACEDESLYALKLTGSSRWILPMGHPLRENPVVVGDDVFINLPDKGMQVIDWRKGTVRWQFTATAQPVGLVHDRLLINNTDELLLVDPQRGKTYRRVAVRRLQTVLKLPDDRLLLISPRGRLLRLDPDL